MSILSYNGGAVLAMSGDNCVAIASDLRFGRELQTISTDFTKVNGTNKSFNRHFKQNIFFNSSLRFRNSSFYRNWELMLEVNSFTLLIKSGIDFRH